MEVKLHIDESKENGYNKFSLDFLFRISLRAMSIVGLNTIHL